MFLRERSGKSFEAPSTNLHAPENHQTSSTIKTGALFGTWVLAFLGTLGIWSFYKRPLSISRVLPTKTASATCVPRFTSRCGSKVSGLKNST